jgi:hypothetical protein
LEEVAALASGVVVGVGEGVETGAESGSVPARTVRAIGGQATVRKRTI